VQVQANQSNNMTYSLKAWLAPMDEVDGVRARRCRSNQGNHATRLTV